MFDLNREVAAWSAAVYAERCGAAASVAELSDHLYCEIDLGRAAGLSDEEAFRTAVARLGTASELSAENAKNRSALGAVCAVAAKLEDPVSRRHRGLMIAHALLWATLMIALSVILKKTELVAWTMLVILVPMWWASERLLRRAMVTR
ncbi:MAG: hypothetical protein QOI24_4401 [Acidobacteriota bacterium]|jgi:hypothetical protein|nr:hypothetical protein [Acidobacteriota bacterium]